MSAKSRTESDEIGIEKEANTPKKMIFESELWTERPKYK